MAHNAKLIADIEALFAVAKSHNDVDLSTDRRVRLDLLGKVEALHYQLDDPADAMFQQIMNVRYSVQLLLPCLESRLHEQ
jgi:hypothetical protein